MNVNKLKGKIVENGLNIPSVARKIGMDKATFYRKLNGETTTFTIKEADAIVNILDLTSSEALAIFFEQNVAQNAK